MADNKTQAELDWQAKLEKYPSLRKLDELGDEEFVEVCSKHHLLTTCLH
jgi:hypothetical protein